MNAVHQLTRRRGERQGARSNRNLTLSVIDSELWRVSGSKIVHYSANPLLQSLATEVDQKTNGKPEKANVSADLHAVFANEFFDRL